MRADGQEEMLTGSGSAGALSTEVVSIRLGGAGGAAGAGARVQGSGVHHGDAEPALLRPSGIFLAVSGAFALYGSLTAGVWRVREVLVDIRELELQKCGAVVGQRDWRHQGRIADDMGCARRGCACGGRRRSEREARLGRRRRFWSTNKPRIQPN
jgi:hypothetical protein